MCNDQVPGQNGALKTVVDVGYTKSRLPFASYLYEIGLDLI